jgi:Fe-Mn family superoxide dismutase
MEEKMAFQTPDLLYAYNDLEPYIDEATMRVHHDKHHTTYTQKLNAAIEGKEYANWSLEDLLKKLSTIPSDIQGAVRNHGGGHYNHNLFWELLTSKSSGEPEGHLAKAIEATFGTFAEFQKQFTAAALNRFGSGWAWLVVAPGKKLEVISTANQDNPLTDGKAPILGLDVWEHAYYLKYQNRRPEYVENFYKVINWKKVGQLYEVQL